MINTDQILKLAQIQLGKNYSSQFESFARNYFEHKFYQEHQLNDPDLCQILLDAWNHFYTRNTCFHIKVTVEQEGIYRCLIHTEKLPFLLDSIELMLHQLDMGMIDAPALQNIFVTRSPEGVIHEWDRDGIHEQFLDLHVYGISDVKELSGHLDRALGRLYAIKFAYEPIKTEFLQIHGHNELGHEVSDFLKWLAQDNFVFMGVQKWTLTSTGLELQSADGVTDYQKGIERAVLTALKKNQSLTLLKLPYQSCIHREGYLDLVVLIYPTSKQILTFPGLMTAKAYRDPINAIPFVRLKLFSILDGQDSTSIRTLNEVAHQIHRDDIFYLPAKELYQLLQGVLAQKEHRKFKTCFLEVSEQNLVICYLFLNKKKFSQEAKKQMSTLLKDVFQAESIEVHLHPLGMDANMLRIALYDNKRKEVNEKEKAQISLELELIATSWTDNLLEHLIGRFGMHQGMFWMQQWAGTFGPDYQDVYLPWQGVLDLPILKRFFEGEEWILDLKKESRFFYLRIFHPDEHRHLSDLLPMLESIGVNVISDHLVCLKHQGKNCYLHDFKVSIEQLWTNDIQEIKIVLKSVLKDLWFREGIQDNFNKLALAAGLAPRQITLMRALAKYSWQIGFNISQSYIEEVLYRNPKLVSALIALFQSRFSIDIDSIERSLQVDLHEQLIEKLLDEVANADADRILRQYFMLIKSIVRTNYFKKENDHFKSYLSFKIDPESLMEIALPKMKYEVFVFGKDMEGIHLRFSKVARGGIRWSDRLDDYRVEILGLVRAQQIKNAVIVPSGAKGGFICKSLLPTDSPKERQEKVLCAYQTLMRGLLDLTDNIVNHDIIKPTQVVCYDDHDPYLVVAADKGTATFSDHANEISKEYGFWLGDAFASGGSVGYDHKKIGITAKGVWESIKQHCYDLGKDPATSSLTVVGVGDLSGDVFGNGLIEHQSIKLLGAFNHLHIFVDPNPDVEIAYQERMRLFQKAQGSWDEYDLGCISEGGAVFSRKDKFLTISPQIQKMIGIAKEKLTPNEMIKALLKMKVDLIFNGGIGTFVKSSQEIHTQVGDKSNDNIRVDADDLGCLMIGEGGNLGMTQKSRIEFAMKGGYVCTDSLDNSAGVDCSDHEVNIKILCEQMVADGKLSFEQRNILLKEMTIDVRELVLKNNRYQNQTIAIANFYAAKEIHWHRAIMNQLSDNGVLDRQLAILPSEQEIEQRIAFGKGLLRPELILLMSHIKMDLKNRLLKDEILEHPVISELVKQEFPASFANKFSKEIAQHPLKKQIIALIATNITITEVGLHFVYRLTAQTGATPESIVRAYLIARNLFETQSITRELSHMMDSPQARLAYPKWQTYNKAMRQITKFVLKFDDAISSWAEIAAFTKKQTQLLVDDKALLQKEASLDNQLIKLQKMVDRLDLLFIAKRTGADLIALGSLYAYVEDHLKLSIFQEKIKSLAVNSSYEAQARSLLIEKIVNIHYALVQVLYEKTQAQPEALIQWNEQTADIQEKWIQRLNDVCSQLETNLSMMIVAIDQLTQLFLKDNSY